MTAWKAPEVFQGQLPRPESLDSFLRSLAEQVHRVMSERLDMPLQLYVPNTQYSTGCGEHWITVAVSIRRRPESDAVHDEVEEDQDECMPMSCDEDVSEDEWHMM